MRCVLLSYDIPTNLRDSNGRRIENPSGKLRRYGFRHQYSSWIMPEQSVPYNIVAELQALGVKVDIVRFDASEGPRLVRAALEALNKSIQEQLERSRATIAEGWERHQNRTAADGLAENTEARAATVKRFEVVQRFNTKYLNDLLEDVRHAAEQFEIDPGGLNIPQARSAFSAFQVGIQAQVAAYSAMTQKLKEAAKTSPTAAAVAAQAEANTLPHYVGSDILQEIASETGDAETAAVATAVNAAFDGGADDNEFSLADYEGGE